MEELNVQKGQELEQTISKIVNEKFENAVKQLQAQFANLQAEAVLVSQPLSNLNQINKQEHKDTHVCGNNEMVINNTKDQKELYLPQVKQLQRELETKSSICFQLRNNVSQLQGDLEEQEQLHLRQVRKLRRALDQKDDICYRLEQEILEARENLGLIQMYALFHDDPKQEEEHHLLKVRNLQKELEAKDNLCIQLEKEISNMRENAEFVLMRQQLQNDLKNQEEIYLREVRKLQEEQKAKDNLCNQLEQEISNMRENAEFVLMRQQLQNDLKNQEEIYLREVRKLQEKLKAKDNLCNQLEQEISNVRTNPEFISMRQQLQDDLKHQENFYLLEITKLQKELEAKDNTCLQLEQEISQVRENPEFVEMRQQLLDDLKNQEQIYIAEINRLKQQSKAELEAKDNICLQLEHEMWEERNNAEVHQQLQEELQNQKDIHHRETLTLKQQLDAKNKIYIETTNAMTRLQENYDLSVSCPICMDPWTSNGAHQLVALRCGHLFGDSCVRESLRITPSCPECRVHSSPNGIRRLFSRAA